MSALPVHNTTRLVRLTLGDRWRLERISTDIRTRYSNYCTYPSEASERMLADVMVMLEMIGYKE